MTPFLHNELFAVNKEVEININKIGDMKCLIIDNIFSNFDALREMVLQCPPGNWKYIEGGRNYVDYYDCRIAFNPRQYKLLTATQKIISSGFSDFVQDSTDGVDVNWFKQIADKKCDFAYPHSDEQEDQQSYTCLIYLNKQDECSGGTAFFRNKYTGKTHHYGNIDLDPEMNEFFIKYPPHAETGFEYWAHKDMQHWEMTGFVEMKPNRMVIFPANYFHAAYHPVNGFFDYPRLTMIYWMRK